METKHTPGPWKVETSEDDYGSCYEIVASVPKYGDRNYIARIEESRYTFPNMNNQVEANAELIARAPELLEENERLTNLYKTLQTSHKIEVATLTEENAKLKEALQLSEVLRKGKFIGTFATFDALEKIRVALHSDQPKS